MISYFLPILSVFAVLGFATCRSSNPTPGAITKDTKIELPGSERINKRSAEDFIEDSTAILSDIPTDDGSEVDGDYSAEYDPSQGGSFGELERLESNEDFALAESSIVFHPLFVSRKRSVSKNRASRSLDNIQGYKIPTRSLNKNKGSDDELELAENGMVFLPLFRSKSRFTERQRLRRSIEDDNLNADEDQVFKRTFRPVRSIPEVQSLRNDGGNLDLDDGMALAENGLIFRPLFRTRQRDTTA